MFDEPEAGIDLWSFQNLTEVFKEIGASSKGTTIVISHQERILNIADQIILMENGKIKKIGGQDMMKSILKTNCPKGAKVYE